MTKYLLLCLCASASLAFGGDVITVDCSTGQQTVRASNAGDESARPVVAERTNDVDAIKLDLKTAKANIATSIDNCTTNIANANTKLDVLQAMSPLATNSTLGQVIAQLNALLASLTNNAKEDKKRAQEGKAVAQELRDVRQALSRSLKDPSP